MAVLNTKPGSSTKKQHQRLVMAGRDKGFELSEIRCLVGGSLRKLSAAQASAWIKRFSGRDLPNPPGQKPRVYRGSPSGFRIITRDQIDQIERLMLDYFDRDRDAAYAWLTKNFKVDRIRQLATAQRAGRVIAVLKTMHNRKLKSP